jgi:hypothetical protein
LSLAYAWERCGADGSGCVPIAGATSARYTLGADDAGRRVRGVVTARNAGGSASASTDPTAPVEAKPDPPTPDPPKDPSERDPASPAPAPEPEPQPEPQPDPPSTSPPAPPPPSETLAATQWKSSTGTGLRLRLDSEAAIASASFAIPAPMLPQRADAGRVAGRLTVYPRGGKAVTWKLRATRSGSLVATAGTGPRLRLGRGSLRVTALPAGARTVKLTLYTRDRTSPRALLTPGATANLAAWLRTSAGALHHLTHRLTAPR